MGDNAYIHELYTSIFDAQKNESGKRFAFTPVGIGCVADRKQEDVETGE